MDQAGGVALRGTRNGLVVHWPQGISERGDVRTQWHHVIDVAPTILEAAGIPHPDRVDGISQRPIEGTSMLYALRDGDAPDQHITQYFEIFGNRGIFHEGWTAVTKHRSPWDLSRTDPIPFDQDTWELYDITRDFSQATDLASEYPERLAALQELFLEQARLHQVLPLDDRGVERMDAAVAGRRSPELGGRVTVPAGTRRLPTAAFPSTSNTSFRLSVPMVADSDGSDGVLVSLGNSFNGLSFYVREGVVTFAHNLCSLVVTHVRATQPLSAGEHLLEYLFTYDGGGIGRGGTGQVLIDGQVVGEGRVERTALFGSGRLTVGANPGTPVTSDYVRGGEYPYTGRIGEVARDRGRQQLAHQRPAARGGTRHALTSIPAEMNRTDPGAQLMTTGGTASRLAVPPVVDGLRARRPWRSRHQNHSVPWQVLPPGSIPAAPP